MNKATNQYMAGQDMEEKSVSENQVPMQITRTNNLLLELEEIAGFIEEQLHSVLRPVVSQKDTREHVQKDRIDIVPLASTLRDQGDRIETVIKHIKVVCDQLQI